MKPSLLLLCSGLSLFASAATNDVARMEEDTLADRIGRRFAFDTELTLYSAYIWRGQIFYDAGVWQPAQNIWVKFGENAEYGRLKLRAWSNWALNAYKKPHRFGNMSIVDETISYNYTAFDCLDFESGFILYQFPNRHGSGMRDTDEFLAGVRWRNPYLTPKVYVWWDFDESGHNDENQLYFDFDLSHPFALTKELTLTLGSGCGVGNGSYMDHYSHGDIDGTAFNNFHSDMALQYAFTKHLKLGASLSYYYSLSRQVRHSSYDCNEHYKAGILRGGVHLVLNF